MRRAVRLHADQTRGACRGSAVEIEAEVSDPCAAFVVDEHVVRIARSESCEIGVKGERAIRLKAQDSAVLH